MMLKEKMVFEIKRNPDAEVDQYRIIYLQRDSDLAVLFRLKRPLRAPEIISCTELAEKLRDGLASISNSYKLPAYVLRSEAEISSIDRSARDASWKMIESLALKEPDIFDAKLRGRLIEELSKLTGKPEMTIRRNIYRYWEFGKIKNALLPALCKCGAKGKKRKRAHKKLGRRPKVVITGYSSDPLRQNVSEDWLDWMLTGFDLYHVGVKNATYQYSYDKTMYHFFVEERNGVLTLLPQHLRPSYSQYVYHTKKERDIVVVKRTQMGEKAWNLRGRALKGSSLRYLYGPGECYEIDSTPLDIWLVSRYRRDWLIGRPVFYAVVDVFSRAVVGVHLGLTSASKKEARRVLLTAFTDKTELLQRHGIFLSYNPFPEPVICQRLRFDRGELIGSASDELAEDLGIHGEAPGPYRGDLKPIVESRFRIFNGTVHFLPGAVLSRFRERGERDYRLDGCLNMWEVMNILLKRVIRHNVLTERPDLLTPEMRADGLIPTALNIWDWGMMNLSGSAPSLPREALLAMLLEQEQASVAETGILLKSNIAYMPESGDYLLQKARAEGRWKIPVRVDPTDPRKIYYVPQSNPMADDFAIETFVLKDTSYADYRFEEIYDALAYEEMQRKERDESRQQEIMNMDLDTEKMIEDAVAEKSTQARGKAKSVLLSNVTQHRQFEREMDSVAQSKRDGTGKNKVIPFPANETEPPIAEDVQQILQEEIND
ncbi:transposase family protein [bacterium]|nr:transposase family protein [bacterium]